MGTGCWRQIDREGLQGGDTGIEIWMSKRREGEDTWQRAQQCKGPEAGVSVADMRHREKLVRHNEGKRKQQRTSGQRGKPVLNDLKKKMNTIKERNRRYKEESN